MWRCLRGMGPPESSHEDYTSIRERRLFLTAGFGEQSSMVAYFLMVSLNAPSRLAIPRHGTPRASRILIRCCIDTGFVIPFSGGLIGGCVLTRKITGLWRTGALHPAISAKRTNSHRFFGLDDYVAPA